MLFTNYYIIYCQKNVEFSHSIEILDSLYKTLLCYLENIFNVIINFNSRLEHLYYL